jgi:hypothetical protein
LIRVGARASKASLGAPRHRKLYETMRAESPKIAKDLFLDVTDAHTICSEGIREPREILA